MNMYHRPWKLIPNKVRGAGGREIDKFRGVSPAVDTPTGSEAWIGSTTRTGDAGVNGADPNKGCAEVILPDGKRMYLFQAINLAPEEVLGKKHIGKNGTNLGVLIKYLDAQRQYGIQAHPIRSFAKKMWNSDFGKEESWYVIGVRDDCPPGYILLGFKEGVTREMVEALADKNDISGIENLCHRILVKPGEAYFVGGGLIHALGEGCFVIEVQEPADITVTPRRRAFLNKDSFSFREKISEEVYNERSFGAFIYDGCSYEENLKRWQIPHRTIREGNWGKEYFIIGPKETSYFAFTQLDLRASVEITPTGFPRVAIALRGQGKLAFSGGEMEVKQADEIFIPYSVPGLKAEGNLSLVLCHPEGAFPKE